MVYAVYSRPGRSNYYTDVLEHAQEVFDLLVEDGEPHIELVRMDDDYNPMTAVTLKEVNR